MTQPSTRSEALKEAQKRHASKLKRVEITFAPEETDLYRKLRNSCLREGVSTNSYIKGLIMREP